MQEQLKNYCISQYFLEMFEKVRNKDNDYCQVEEIYILKALILEGSKTLFKNCIYQKWESKEK